MTLSDSQIDSKLDSPQRIRMLRLLQWQLQHLLSFESAARSAGANESESFEVKIRSHIPIEQLSHIKPEVLIQRSSRHETTADSSVAWILDILDVILRRTLSSRIALGSMLRQMSLITGC